MIVWGQAERIHEKVCPEKIVSCAHCGLSLTRGKLTDHHLTCADYPLDCEYKFLDLPGCGTAIARKHYQQHVEEFASRHLVALHAKYKVLEIKTKETTVDFSKQHHWRIENWKGPRSFRSNRFVVEGTEFSLLVDKDGCSNSLLTWIELIPTAAHTPAQTSPRSLSIYFVNRHGCSWLSRRVENERWPLASVVTTSEVEKRLDADGGIGVFVFINW